MKKRISIVLILASVLLLGGCYPHGAEYVEDLDVVLTKHNKDYDFTAKATYAMPDQIVKITGDVAEGEDPSFIPDVNAQVILATIANNMADLGWVRVDLEDDPDVFLLPAAWETTTIYYYYDYWYYWYGGYWGGYWPYYPPVYASSYTTGTLLMSITDPAVVSTDGNRINQWSGAINGLLTGNFDANRINEAINKAFAASPYLKTN
jgi:hypothetical protein